jgi:type IV fimbrial biogenesis protein FimT
MMHRASRGLTLLEMMIALAIVAVLTTLALPSVGSMMSRHRLKAAAETLSMDLAELRLLATQRGQPMHVNLSTGPQWCYALAVASGCDCRVPQGCQLKTVRAQDHPGVTLLEGQDLRIDPQPGQGGGSALLQGSDGARLRVGLSPLGRPKVCAPDAAVPGFAAC